MVLFLLVEHVIAQRFTDHTEERMRLSKVFTSSFDFISSCVCADVAVTSE